MLMITDDDDAQDVTRRESFFECSKKIMTRPLSLFIIWYI